MNFDDASMTCQIDDHGYLPVPQSGMNLLLSIFQIADEESNDLTS